LAAEAGSHAILLSVRIEAHSLSDHATRRFAFVMEQQVGLRTNYLNWRRITEMDPSIDATWVPITYYQEGGFLEKLSFLPRQPRAQIRCYLQVDRGLGRRKYDCVLFNTYNPAVLHRSTVHQQRCFLMFDVTPVQYDAMGKWYGHTPDKDGLISRWKRNAVTDVFRHAEGLLVCSKWVADSAVNDYGADPKRIHILPFSVDTKLWTPAADGSKPVDSPTRILFTGGDFERKGGDLLLKWAAETSRRGWELHLVTSKRFDPPPGVVVHNNMGNNAQDLIDLARSCDLFALPTRADCYSIASLEAMAVGLPVITCDVGGIADIVEEGKSGYLLKPDDYGSLRDRLEALLDSPDLRARMGKHGREIVEERYDTEFLVKRGLKLMAGG
jgi:glycosyltransferase involved in cell wall biosynthesis